MYRTQYDDGFRADMGFIGQVGYVQDLGGLTRHWWDDAEALFNHITVNGRWYSNRTNDGALLDLNRDAWVGLNGPMQSYIEVGHLWRDKAWNGQRFDESLDRVRINFKPMRGVNIQFFVRHGDRVDLANTQLGEVTTINPYVSLNIGRSLIVSVNHNYERLSRDGGDVYVANLTDLRLSYQFNLRQRLRLAILRNDLQRDPSLYINPLLIPEHRRDINTQLIYSYKINPRTALYAGYADGYFGGEMDIGNVADVPEFEYQPTFQTDRTLFLKIGYAWSL